MEKNRTRSRSRAFLQIACMTVTAASMMLAAGCGNKANETTAAPSAVTPATNVPPATAQAAQGQQQMGQQIGQDAAANAAAFKAAREKAEGR